MEDAGADLDALTAARRTVSALISGGVVCVVLCPGSRSAPLAYALAESELRGSIEVLVRIDERDAGFLAVGLAAASGRPVAVVTTSGTAVGELMPAMMEADHAGLPVVALTADRPEELQGTGANQTTSQRGLFAGRVRADLHVPAGQDPTATVAQGLAAADGDAENPSGPIHVNLAFRDPLFPSDDAALLGAPELAPRPAQLSDIECLERDSEDAIFAEASSHLAERLRDAAGARRRRAVVLAGHGAGPVAADFARALDLPLLAEPSSDARFGPSAISAYQYVLEHLENRVEAVVLFGRPTLSRGVGRLLARAPETAMYLPEPVAWFTPGRRREVPMDALTDLAAFAGAGPEGWLQEWLEADAAVTEALELTLAGHEAQTGALAGPALAATVWSGLQCPLVVGSSRPIRDLDLMARPRTGRGPHVYANRGLAGIDGTIATAAGVALAERRRTVALMGDVTAVHDAGGLLLPTLEREPRLDVIVAQDDGGSIFATLEHGTVGARGPYADPVARFFRTPHGVDLQELAEAYGWDAHTAMSHEAVSDWLRAGATAVGRRLLQVPVEAEDPRGLHRALGRAAGEALAGLS